MYTITGDWVNVEIIEEKDSCIENTITVRSIKPVRCFEIVGHITHWDTSTNNGIIDSKIIFSASVCTSHYDPVVGDKVNKSMRIQLNVVLYVLYVLIKTFIFEIKKKKKSYI